MKQNNNSRVMVFVDIRNIIKGAKNSIPEHFRVDLEEMVAQVVGDRNLVAAYAFDGEPRDDNLEAGMKLHTQQCDDHRMPVSCVHKSYLCHYWQWCHKHS